MADDEPTRKTAAAKTSGVRNAAAKTIATKKTGAKKSAVGKVTTKKSSAKKVSAKTTTAKKVGAKKVGTKTTVAKTAGAKKAKAKKATVKTSTVRTTATDEPVTPTEIAEPKPARRKIAKVWYGPRDPRPKRISATARLDLPPPASGTELVERVTWAIERELNQIELIVGGHHVKPAQRTEAERRARTLASLARTLSLVAQLREKTSPRLKNDDAAAPCDLDDLRESLARRLERLIADRSQPADCGPHSG